MTAVHSVAGLLPPGARAAGAIGRFARRTTRSRTPRSSAAARSRGPAKSASRITACCFSTRCSSSAATCSKCCASRSKKGASTIARAARTAVFPARFMLVGAMNPCPCGFAGDPMRECRCTPQQIARYRDRLSGPLRDRLDLTVEVPALPLDALGARRRRRAVRRGARARRRGARAAKRAALRGATAFAPTPS